MLVPDDASLMGRQFQVKITSVGKFHLVGEVLEGSMKPKPDFQTLAKDFNAAVQAVHKTVEETSNEIVADVESRSSTRKTAESDSSPNSSNVFLFGALFMCMLALVFRYISSFSSLSQ